MPEINAHTPDKFCNICGTELICDIYPRYSTVTGKLKEHEVNVYCPYWHGPGVNNHYFKNLTVKPKDVWFYKTIERQPKESYPSKIRPQSISPATWRLILTVTALIISGTILVILMVSN